MTKIDIHEEVFNSIYLPYLQNYSRIQILFGGSASGKSVFEAQRCIWDLLQGGRNYLVCRQVARTIRGSVATEIGKVITAWGLAHLFTINKTDGTITCIENGYQVVFVGLDDVEKLKSIVPLKGSWSDIWVEEATELEKDSIKQLLKRQRGGSNKTPKRLTLSFNPILRQHWIFQEYFAGLGWADEQKEYTSPELSILKTTYKDNKFLTHDDIRDLESEKDRYYYNVYTLGNWGVLGNVIFTNWIIQDLSGMQEQFTNRRNGLDFGFSTDPAAVIVSHYDKTRKTIYVFDELYETGLTNDVLAERVKVMFGKERVVCDSAEPKSIAEIRRLGVDAFGARKGKDSVVHGIQWLQQQSVIIDKKCVNFQGEVQTYKWKEDAGGAVVRSGGLPVPVDRNNHLIDALRYAYEEEANQVVMEVTESPFYN